MKRIVYAVAAFVAANCIVHAAFANVFVYRGLCDASAAIGLGKDHFVVADDETNVLRVYKQGVPEAVDKIDVSSLLDIADDEEADIEGAARIGDRIYWITSHGANKKGKPRPLRRRLFATSVDNGPVPTVRPIEKHYDGLVEVLGTDPRYVGYGLAAAAEKAPKTEGALNIEGLAATPEGGLLIGLRNPVPGGEALIVPLENPADAVAGRPIRLGDPIRLNLSGRGVRSIERVGNSYLIVAGPIDEESKFDLYRWSPDKKQDPTIVAGPDLSGLSPEALFAVPETDLVQILSDDGSERNATKMKCKDLLKDKQSFRSIRFKP